MTIPSSSMTLTDERLEEDRIDALRLKAFKTNDEKALSEYYRACSNWFQDRHYRALDQQRRAASAASPAETAPDVAGFDLDVPGDQIAMAVATLDGEKWVRLSDHLAALRQPVQVDEAMVERLTRELVRRRVFLPETPESSVDAIWKLYSGDVRAALTSALSGEAGK